MDRDYLIRQFVLEFGKEPCSFFSAPGRTELVGNHCDHQHGRVLSAALRMQACAAVLPGLSGSIRIAAEGFEPFEVDLSDLSFKPEEAGTSAALVRGIASYFSNISRSDSNFESAANFVSDTHTASASNFAIDSVSNTESCRGFASTSAISSVSNTDSCRRSNSNFAATNTDSDTTIGSVSDTHTASASNSTANFGFDAYITSDIPAGKGLSSSAAFEVLIARIINELGGFGLGELELARIGMLAENNYYGKPCGLMDQTISAVGKCVTVDFLDPDKPAVEEIPFAPADHGYALCIIDTGASHDDLTDDFANIITDMAVISKHFHATHLRDVAPSDFFELKSELVDEYGQRAADRACHFILENDRVAKAAQALKDNRFEDYLAYVNESGRSSETLLCNITSEYHPELTALSDTLELLAKMQNSLLGGKGAYRVHGGGFAGTAQAYVPLEKLDAFRKEIEAALGVGSCLVVF